MRVPLLVLLVGSVVGCGSKADPLAEGVGRGNFPTLRTSYAAGAPTPTAVDRVQLEEAERMRGPLPEGFRDRRTGSWGEQVASDGVENARPERRLATVYFTFDSDLVDPSALQVLERNLMWIEDHPNLRILLRGHADDSGTETYNLALGSRRAQAVRAALIERGVAPTRLETVSFGEALPASPGRDEASLARNRRVEFHVY
jgi:peptidoglycan-associated lipoprotein